MSEQPRNQIIEAFWYFVSLTLKIIIWYFIFVIFATGLMSMMGY